MNSIDTEELIRAYVDFRDADLTAFSQLNSLVPGKTFGFIGGLDASKRISYLAETMDFLWAHDPEVKILVAGRGEHQDLLSPAVARGQAVTFGYSGSAEKALICRLSQALINPGRIGLVAVDALALGIPILTTSWNLHAPEYEYLEPGVDVLESGKDPSDLGLLILGHRAEDRTVRAHSPRPHPDIANMVANFANAVNEMLSS